MKAWLIRDKYGAEFCSTIVFAETRGKAIYLALTWLDYFEDFTFIDMHCTRAQDADKLYKEGKKYLDWYIPEDRLFLVKEYGFSCEEFHDACESCVAKDYCGLYEEYKKYEEDYV